MIFGLIGLLGVTYLWFFIFNSLGPLIAFWSFIPLTVLWVYIFVRTFESTRIAFYLGSGLLIFVMALYNLNFGLDEVAKVAAEVFLGAIGFILLGLGTLRFMGDRITAKVADDAQSNGRTKRHYRKLVVLVGVLISLIIIYLISPK